MSHKRPILETGIPELSAWLKGVGEPAYRAKQIREWIAHRRATNFEAMSNLPKGLREKLDADWNIFQGEIIRAQEDELAKKLLVAMHDKNTIECVLLFQEARRTVCLSTQVGCAMGCVFCASGLDGVERNLTTGEMIEQLLLLRNLLPAEERLSHIVVMGMGEPLANLDNLLPALEYASSPEGLGIGARHITISSVGLPAKIRELANLDKQYQLAVSLHAPDDELRRQIVPTAKNVQLADILAASDEYRQKTGRQITFEYVMLGGLNDRAEHAHKLVKLLGRRDAFVNIIPYNPVPGLPYETPDSRRVGEFADILRNAGISIKIRKRKGARINAACGQLRRSQDPFVPLVVTP